MVERSIGALIISSILDGASSKFTSFAHFIPEWAVFDSNTNALLLFRLYTSQFGRLASEVYASNPSQKGKEVGDGSTRM